jgi:hypothetical protein
MKARTMRRIYLREAVCMLLFVQLLVRFVRPETVFAWARRPPRCVRRFAGEEIGWACWAVETIGAKGWIKASSMSRALAAHAMLRRRGVASRFCLGVARDGNAFVTRAWVEAGQTVVLGGGGSQVTRLAAFGGTH